MGFIYAKLIPRSLLLKQNEHQTLSRDVRQVIY